MDLKPTLDELRDIFVKRKLTGEEADRFKILEVERAYQMEKALDYLWQAMQHASLEIGRLNKKDWRDLPID